MNRDKDLVNKLLVGRSVIFANEHCSRYPGYIIELTNTWFEIHTDKAGAWNYLYMAPCLSSGDIENFYSLTIGYAFQTRSGLTLLYETLMKLNSDLSIAYNLAHELNLLPHLADDQYEVVSDFKVIEEK